MIAGPGSFLDVLCADGPGRDRADEMALYGQFIGSWEADIITHERSGLEHRGSGEIHFAWVLEGRAIQDVWMIPRRSERRPGIPSLPVAGNWYARRSASTIPASTPGTFFGSIRRHKSTRGRSGGPGAMTSSRKARCPTGRSCDGALPASPRILSTGLANIRPMRAPHGGFRSRCLPGVSRRREGRGLLPRAGSGLCMPLAAEVRSLHLFTRSKTSPRRSIG